MKMEMIYHLEVEWDVGLGEINIEPCCHVDTRHKVQAGVEQPGQDTRVAALRIALLLPVASAGLGAVLPHNQVEEEGGEAAARHAHNHDVPELVRVLTPNLLAGVPGEAEEDPGCDVHQQVGDHREAIPHRGQQRPGVLII